LTLNGSDANNPELMSDSLSMKSNPQLKKRRFRELDRNCWSINDTRSDTMLIATATQNV
jgi:hypothetical protein